MYRLQNKVGTWLSWRHMLSYRFNDILLQCSMNMKTKYHSKNNMVSICLNLFKQTQLNLNSFHSIVIIFKAWSGLWKPGDHPPPHKWMVMSALNTLIHLYMRQCVLTLVCGHCVFSFVGPEIVDDFVLFCLAFLEDKLNSWFS